MGHSIVTNGFLCVSDGDAALTKLLWDFFIVFVTVGDPSALTRLIVFLVKRRRCCLLQTVACCLLIAVTARVIGRQNV